MLSRPRSFSTTMLALAATLFLGFLLAVPAAQAQYTTGTVQGTVLDPSGAAVANAKVTLRSTSTNAVRTFTTGPSGTFAFPAVAPGQYVLSVSATGFTGAVAALTATASQVTSQTMRLTLAGANTTVTVQATPAQINTTNSQQSVTRGTIAVDNLPTARSVTSLVSLAPGVQPMHNLSGGGGVKVGGSETGQISANGGRPEYNNYELDFTDANDWEFGGQVVGIAPAPDMLQEYKVLTSNVPAQYGIKSSGIVEMVTKSGTNNWHGQAYDFIQNNDLNASDYLTHKQHRIDDNNYGFSMGGPIQRNKTFFFGGWERDKSLGGGFSDLATVFTAAGQAAITDPTAAALAKTYMPVAPTALPGNPDLGNITQTFSAPATSHQFILRGDHQFTPAQSLAVRYFQSNGTSVLTFPQFNTLAGFDSELVWTVHNLNLQDTWEISPNTVNQARAAATHALANLPPQGGLVSPRIDFADGTANFGGLQFFTQGRTFNVYEVNDILSWTTGRHMFNFGGDFRDIEDNSVNETNDRGLYVFGSYTDFQAGNPVSYQQSFGPTALGFRTRLYDLFVQDDYRLSSSLTLDLGLRWEDQGSVNEAHGLLSILDPALPGSIGVAGSGPLGTFKVGNPVINGNHFNLAPRLGFAWNPGSGKLVVRGGYGIYYNAFNFTSLSEARTNPPLNYAESLGFGQFTNGNTFDSLIAGTAPIQTSTQAQLGGFGTLTNFGSITTANPSMHNPYMQQYNLGVEYQITPSTMARIGYVGSEGTHLDTYMPLNPVAPANRPAPATSLADQTARFSQFVAAQAAENYSPANPTNNRLDPRFNSVNQVNDAASSNFNSLQLELRRSFAAGLEFDGAYTWSKSMDDSSSSNPTQEAFDFGFPQNANDLHAEWAPSNFDIPQRLVVTWVWQLPFGAGQSGLASRLIKGWTFSAVNAWQSGIPANIYAGPVKGPGGTVSDINMDGLATPAGPDNTRADCNAGGTPLTLHDPSIPSSQTEFTEPLLGNDGSCGRNVFRLNSVPSMNWALSKNIALRESGPVGSGPWNLQIRAEANNVFNHVFRSVSSFSQLELSNPNPGAYNTAGSMRTVLLAIRLLW